MGLAYDIATFDPARATGATPLAINWHIFEAPMEIDRATRALHAGLAVEPPERVGPTTYRIRLRSGAIFHDGSPVRAEDVVYSLRRILDPSTNSIFANYLNFIADARALDARTVEFALHFPTTALAARLPNLKVVPRALVERVGATAFGTNPVGSGPYAFVSARANDAVRLRRFAAYDGPRKGSIDDLRFRIQIEPASRIASISTGEILAAESVPYLDLDYLRRNEHLHVDAVPAFGQVWMMFNCAKPPFADARVRRALLHAIDRDAITRIVYRGNARPAVSYLPADHPMFHRPAHPPLYDPERARAMLRSAGIPKGWSFDLQVSTTGWVLPQATLVQQNLAEAGINARVRTGESGALYANVADGSYSAFLSSGDPSIFGYDADTLFRWYFVKTWPEQFFYWHGPQQRDLQSTIERAFRSASVDEQRALYAHAQDVIADACPIFPLHHVDQATAYARTLAGFQPLPTTGLYLADARVQS